MKISSKLTHFEQTGGTFSVQTDGPEIRIICLTPEIIRVRASFDGNFDEGSYILTLTAWEDRLDEFLGDERTRVEPLIPEVTELENEIRLDTGEAVLIIQKEPFGMKLTDKEGDVLYSDIYGHPFTQDSKGRVSHYTRSMFDECFYGFGEKAGHLNKARTSYMRMDGKDAMGWDAISSDPLYKHIPFYIRLNRRSRKALGLFYNNTYNSAFSMGGEVSSPNRFCAYFTADGGDIDLFLIAGNSMEKILENYTLLTGRPALLPKQALGYQGSGMIYAEQPEKCEPYIQSFLDTAKEEGYPMDGFYLSSGYTEYEGRRCVFTWSKMRYPDPDGFIERMNEQDIPVVPNVKPGILLCHPKYKEYSDQGVFIKNADGSGNEVGVWWGGPGSFWDFTAPAARQVWKSELKKNLIEKGIKSIWNDNCEYDGILDYEAICDNDGDPVPVGSLRPVLPNLMNKMAREAIEENDPDTRPYLVSRGGYSGIQRYSQTWGGDTVTSWDTLKYNISTILGMSLSGAPNYGMDICGFTGTSPDPELLVRWIQSGIFQPRFCIHSSKLDFTIPEPWMYPSVNGIVRDALKLRYRLMPYLYSAEYAASVSGEPIMRPLIYDFQYDDNCCDEDVNYMFGRSILVANVVEQGEKVKKVYLPAGTNWYDFYTHRMYKGGQTLEIPVDLSSLPLFIREGAVIPMADNEIMNLARDKVTDLRVVISPKGDLTYIMYDDDGKTNDFKKGVYLKTAYEVIQGNPTIIRVKKEGSYKDSVKNMVMEVISPEGSPGVITLNSEKLRRHFARHTLEKENNGWYYDTERRTILIKYEVPEGNYEINVIRQAFTVLDV